MPAYIDRHTTLIARARIDAAGEEIDRISQDPDLTVDIDYADFWQERVERVEQEVMRFICGEMSAEALATEVVQAWELNAERLRKAVAPVERVLATLDVEGGCSIQIIEVERESRFIVRRPGTGFGRSFQYGALRTRAQSWAQACEYAGEVAGLTEDPR